MPETAEKKKAKEENLHRLYGGFDLIGDVAIIKPPKGLKTAKIRQLADNLMQRNSHIHGVFKKAGKIEGTERLQKLVWVHGTKNSLVLHKENGCLFYVDVKKVFFTPRLGSERLRVTGLAKPNEEVLDMFCGVGPYSIQIAKRVREVYAIDINQKAIELLKRNLSLNKIKNVKAICGDSKKVVKDLNEKFDRIIMNFPLAAKDFLDAALKVSKDDCVIHLYTFLDTKPGYSKAVKSMEKEIRSRILKKRKISKIDAKRAGEVAPYLIRECFDIYLKV